MTKLIIFLFFIFTITKPFKVEAVENPLAFPNNKFGIHIVEENDLENAAYLVNSSNGDWGYVKFVIGEDDRNVSKWQKIFEVINRYHLIPIVRLATKANGNYWSIPKLEEAQNWAQFLSGLPWKTKNRYIILFNEPNHAKEWGNIIDPYGYAQIVKAYSEILKQSSEDFFILMAGFDASATNSRETMDETVFLKSVLEARPNVFDFIDGWASHSYPNPGFRGKITDTGRGTLTTYQWELDFLKHLGIKKDLPVFITETGWPHREGTEIRNDYYSSDEVANLITEAAETVWKDKNIVAIVPFILNYQSYPFSHFSWQKLNSDEFYPQFDAFRSIPKIAGKPALTDEDNNNKSVILPKDNSQVTEPYINPGNRFNPLSLITLLPKFISKII